MHTVFSAKPTLNKLIMHFVKCLKVAFGPEFRSVNIGTVLNFKLLQSDQGRLRNKFPWSDRVHTDNFWHWNT